MRSRFIKRSLSLLFTAVLLISIAAFGIPESGFVMASEEETQTDEVNIEAPAEEQAEDVSEEETPAPDPSEESAEDPQDDPEAEPETGSDSPEPAEPETAQDSTTEGPEQEETAQPSEPAGDQEEQKEEPAFVIGGSEDDLFDIDPESIEYAEEMEEDAEEEIEEEEEMEDVPVFAGESGTADLATLPLLDLNSADLKVCAFCEGKDLGKAQKAVILAWLKHVSSTLDCTANDGAGILSAAGIEKKDYSAWCEKKDLEEADLTNQLTYLYSVLFKNAEEASTADKNISVFRKTDNVRIAAEALYSAAVTRGIKIPCTKEEITENIIPAARDYLAMFRLGGEKREGTAGTAYYCQGNYGNIPYDTDNVAGSGCGITAFSMVASELTGLNLGPEVTATWAYENGVNTVTNWGAYWWLAERFGVEFLGQYSGGFDLAVEALKEGKLVIASLRKDGFFTTSDAGHYILLTGVEKDGRICVNDPASYERSVYGPFEYSAVFGHCLQFWIFGR